jgi:hypothetical protein
MTREPCRHLWRAMIAAPPDDQTPVIGRQLNLHGVAGSAAQTPVAGQHRDVESLGKCTYAAS